MCYIAPSRARMQIIPPMRDRVLLQTAQRVVMCDVVVQSDRLTTNGAVHPVTQ